MTEESQFIQECGRKRRYRKYAYAVEVLRKGIENGKLFGCHIYKCDYCLGWHIGHPKGFKKEGVG